MKKENEKMDWIVGEGGTNADGVFFTRLNDVTREQVAQYIFDVVQKRKENDEENYDFGTESVEEVESRDGGELYAYACFYDYHVDVSAVPVKNIPQVAL